MLLTTDEILKLLRMSVKVQQEESEVIDPAFLAMSDEDLMLYVKLGVSRAYPKVTDLADLPEGSEYPIVLLSKIELYLALAVLKVDKVDMSVDNNNYLKNSQRFSHYMSLVDSVKEQYENWLENEGQGEVSSYEVLLDNRHYSSRNYENQKPPKVSLYIDSVLSNSVDFHWSVKNTSHFASYKVYFSSSPIIDMFKEGAFYKDKLTENGEVLVLSTMDIRNNHHRLTGLKPGASYYLAIISLERNRIWGYKESSFETPPVLDDDDEFSVTSIEGIEDIWQT